MDKLENHMFSCFSSDRGSQKVQEEGQLGTFQNRKDMCFSSFKDGVTKTCSFNSKK